MKDGKKTFNESRRNVLKQGAAAVVGVVATGMLVKTTPALAAKASKAEMSYMDKPLGKNQCDGCMHFVPGPSKTKNGTCKVVSGSISPHGWCVAFVPKS